MPVSLTTSYRRGASTSDACANECMCAADSRSAPPRNTSAPSVTSVAVSSVDETTRGAPTDEAALSATRICATRSNEWFDIAVSADRSSHSEATLQWQSVHSDSCARIHMSDLKVIARAPLIISTCAACSVSFERRSWNKSGRIRLIGRVRRSQTYVHDRYG